MPSQQPVSVPGDSILRQRRYAISCKLGIRPQSTVPDPGGSAPAEPPLTAYRTRRCACDRPSALFDCAERRQLPTVQYGRPLLPKAVTPDAFRALLAPGADSQRVQRAYVMRSSVQGHGCSQELAYVK